MPDLYNLPNAGGSGTFGDNARSIRVGDTKFGTRRIQFYTVYLTGLTTAEVEKIILRDPNQPNSGARQIIEDSDYSYGMGGMGDQPPAVEYRGPTILEAIVRGVQKLAEVYAVYFPYITDTDPDYWDLTLTIAVNADTVQSAWEQIQSGAGPWTPPQNVNLNSEWLLSSVQSALDDYNPIGGWDNLDVSGTFIYGDQVGNYTPVALSQSPEANALHLANKAARLSQGGGRKGSRNPG